MVNNTAQKVYIQVVMKVCPYIYPIELAGKCQVHSGLHTIETVLNFSISIYHSYFPKQEDLVIFQWYILYSAELNGIFFNARDLLSLLETNTESQPDLFQLGRPSPGLLHKATSREPVTTVILCIW